MTGDETGTRRRQVTAIVVALAISVAAGTVVWRAFGGLGERQARASKLPPLDKQTIPRNDDGVPTVLVIRCDRRGIEVITPVVASQSDGLHVRAYITNLHDPEVILKSIRANSPTYLSGSSGVNDEFVRPVSVGRARVHCESGPQQGDGPEDFEAPFEVVDPSGTFVEYALDCGEGEPMGAEHTMWAPSAAAAVTAVVNGLRPGDSVEEAGFLSDDPGRPGYVRVVRSGSVVAWFDVTKEGGSTWYIVGGQTCPGSGLTSADPSWVTIWSDSTPSTPPPGETAYVVSDVQLQIQPDIPSDVVHVSYRLSWNTDQSPGGDRCITRVFDAAGRQIGEADVGEDVPDNTKSGWTIRVDGEPARATVECT